MVSVYYSFFLKYLIDSQAMSSDFEDYTRLTEYIVEDDDYQSIISN